MKLAERIFDIMSTDFDADIEYKADEVNCLTGAMDALKDHYLIDVINALVSTAESQEGEIAALSESIGTAEQEKQLAISKIYT